MFKALKKLATHKELKRKIITLESQYNDKEYSIEELQELINTPFSEFMDEFNSFANEHNIQIKLIQNPQDDQEFSILENEEELYKKSQIDSTHALREKEYIPTMGKIQKEIKLFVSYSRKDKEYVEALISDLEQTPYPFNFWKDDSENIDFDDIKNTKEFLKVFQFWKDDEQLVSGNSLNKIHDAIQECDFGLLMVSENYESNFIVQYELPYFIEFQSSKIQKSKPSVPLFIKTKKEIEKLNYINETLVFSYKDQGYMETLRKEEYIEALSQEILKAFHNRDKEQKQIVSKLYNDSDVKELNKFFVKTQSDKGIDVVHEIKNWAKSKNSTRYFALLGDSGMGKTWSCMKIALELLQEDNYLKPIYIDLRHFAVSDSLNKNFEWKNVINIVVSKSINEYKKDMSINIIFDLIKEGKAFIIFDGLDEVTVHLSDSKSNDFIRELRKIALINSNNKVLFSCRTHYFRTIQEQFSMLSGHSRENFLKDDFQSMILIPFKRKQITEYCKKNNIDINIFHDIVRSIHNLEEMAQRPYSLKLITLQIEKLEMQRKIGQEINTSDIYMNIIEESLNRDYGKHSLSKTHKPLIMRELAAYMWREQVKELFYPRLEEWFTHWLHNNSHISDEYRNESREKLKADLRGATFIVRPNSDSFRFSHTSLQEFFLAWYLFDALGKEEFNKFSITIPSIEVLEFFIMLWKKDTNNQKLYNNFNKLILKHSLIAFEIYLIASNMSLNIPIKSRFHLKNQNFSMRKIRGKSSKIILKNSIFENINFNNTNLENLDLENTNFINCMIYNSTWKNINFYKAEFSHCNIQTLLLRKSNLIQSYFQQTIIKYSKLFFCNYEEYHENFFQHIVPISSNKIPTTLQPYISKPHEDSTKLVIFSPDTKLMASISNDKTIKVYDLDQMEIIKSLKSHKKTITKILFSRNFLISSAKDKKIKIYDLKTLKCIQTFDNHEKEIQDISISNDEKLLVSYSKNNVSLYNLKKMECIQSLTLERKSQISGLSLSKDGFSLCFILNDNILELYTKRKNFDYKKSFPLKGKVNFIFSEDSKILAYVYRNVHIRLISLSSFQETTTFNLHSKPITSIAFSSNNKLLASSSKDKTVKLYDLERMVCIKSFEEHHTEIDNIIFDNDSKFLVSSSIDGNIKIYSLETLEVIYNLWEHNNRTDNIIFSHDNKFFAFVSKDKNIKIYELETFEVIKNFSPSSKLTYKLNKQKKEFLYAAGDAWKYLYYQDINNPKNIIPTEAFGAIEGLE